MRDIFLLIIGANIGLAVGIIAEMRFGSIMRFLLWLDQQTGGEQ